MKILLCCAGGFSTNMLMQNIFLIPLNSHSYLHLLLYSILIKIDNVNKIGMINCKKQKK
ncbi:hypothetical protein [Clostridioides difficile]|uniref:hypothetical protein n=1 Tax=Clostridioides difficile TaxID=1496 RepID=UPI001CA5D5DB|nr:hypothetical protein [Clostridioides difficile]